METHNWWQRICVHRWLALLVSVLIIAPLAYVALECIIYVVDNQLLHNEDIEALLFLFGLPFCAGAIFLVVAAVYHFVTRVTISGTIIVRGALLACVLFALLLRGVAYAMLALRPFDIWLPVWENGPIIVWMIATLLSGITLSKSAAPPLTPRVSQMQDTF